MWETIILTTLLLLMFLGLRYIVDGKISARFQYALWLIVAIRLLFAWVPMPDSKISVFPLARASVESLMQMVNHADGNSHEEILGNSEIVLDGGEGQEIQGSRANGEKQSVKNASISDISEKRDALETEDATNIENSFGITKILLRIYMIGVCVLFLLIVLRNLIFYLGLRNNRIRYEGELPFANIPGKVYLLEQAVSPFLFGRNIYIAPGMLQDTKSLRYCLVHETCHFKQGDMFWPALRNLCLIMYWYHPLVWLCVCLSYSDAELACDERVISWLGEEHRLDYGETLLALIKKQAWGSDGISLSTQMSGSKRNIGKRMERIAQKKRKWISAAIVVMIGMAIALLFTLPVSLSGGRGSGGNVASKSDWSVTETEGFPAMVVDENGDIVDFVRGNLLKKLYLTYYGYGEDTAEPMSYSIKENAFSNCVNLKTLIITNQTLSRSYSGYIEEIDENAFAGCPQDMVVYCEEDSYVWDRFKEMGFQVEAYDDRGNYDDWLTLGENPRELEKLKEITSFIYELDESPYTKEDLRKAYGEPYFVMTQSGKLLSQYHSESLTTYSKAEVLFPKEARGIYGTFCEDITLTKTITIPAHIVEIGDSAFQDCQIEQLEFEKGSELEKIGVHAFRWSQFSHIKLPEGLKELGDYAFYSCDSLKEITIPSSVEKIGKSCFGLCGLETVTILNPSMEFPRVAKSESGLVFDKYMYSEEKEDMVSNTKLTIRCYKGSTAEAYAKKLNLKVEYI